MFNYSIWSKGDQHCFATARPLPSETSIFLFGYFLNSRAWKGCNFTASLLAFRVEKHRCAKHWMQSQCHAESTWSVERSSWTGTSTITSSTPTLREELSAIHLWKTWCSQVCLLLHYSSLTYIWYIEKGHHIAPHQCLKPLSSSGLLRRLAQFSLCYCWKEELKSIGEKGWRLAEMTNVEDWANCYIWYCQTCVSCKKRNVHMSPKSWSYATFME